MVRRNGKIKVLEVIWALVYGGAERVVMELSRNLDREKYDVHICCTKAKGLFAEQIEKEGIPVHVLAASNSGADYLSGLKLLRLIHREKPAILHTHDTGALLDGSFARLFCRVPFYVHTFHYGNYPHSQKRHIIGEMLASKMPDKLIAVSNEQRKTLMQYMKISPDRILTIWNGVAENPNIGNLQLTESIKRELNIGPNDVIIGTIAIFSEQKGLCYLLDCARIVVDRMPDAKFLLIGDGDLRPELEKQSHALGLENNVVFTGLRSDVQELITVFDIFLMSSLWEGMPLTLLEAIAAGKPVIATDVGDNAMVVNEGVTGHLIPPGDPKKMAEAVLSLCCDVSVRSTMGSRAMDSYKERFHSMAMVEEYDTLFRSYVDTDKGTSYSLSNRANTCRM